MFSSVRISRVEIFSYLPVWQFSIPSSASSMESLFSLKPSHHHHQSLLSLNHHHSTTPFSSVPFLSLPSSSSSSSASFRFSPIKASHSPKNPLTHVTQTLNPFFSPILKSACIAAALFLMRLHFNSPALAAAVTAAPQPPSPATESSPEDASGEEKVSGEENSTVEDLQSLIEAKIRERKFDEAVPMVDRLIEIEPEELDWPLLKAHLRARNNDHAVARNLFEEVLKRDPYNVIALHGLLVAAFELKEPTKDFMPRFEEAVKFLEKEERDSEARDLKLLIAQVKVLEGELSSALKVYEDLVTKEPKDFRPYLCKGVVYTMMKKKDEAERQFEKFRELVPEDHHHKDYFEDNANVFLQKLEQKKEAALKR
ncbi:protein SLOW GREEN 1 [Arachis hypogaea]|nr:protein SLOW GREEN 1 [Arachis hypogaea]QHO53104.1 protein SLOW GREEN 1 [Arachis hypogaea]RYR73649.1 hypothetical protein Ahy_A02g008089 isoform A [Arachis hypogaea]RYR73650.1 hypothetical protein Ahy_A02g008089 isoform B [Arachis hypogaea]